MANQQLSKPVLWFAILALIGISTYLLRLKTRQLSEESVVLDRNAARWPAPPPSETPAVEPAPVPSSPPLPSPTRGTGVCGYAISHGTIFHYTPSLSPGDVPPTAQQQRERVEVSGVFFGREPETGSRALVLPYPGGEAVRLRIAQAALVPGAPPPALWFVELEEASHTSLKDLQAVDPGRRPEYPRDAVVIWPVPAGAVALVDAANQELPPGVRAPVVRTAVDLTADGSADLLVVEFCCGDRSRRNECDYHCGETWQRL
ncbi:MAG: hypothetical protein V3T72_21520, partial [Thermoanaerobaculia bacterium]